jgi:hypothetical protein
MKFKFSQIKFFTASFLMVTATALVLLSQLSAQEPSRFISAIDDLPLMDGLIEDLGSATVFETAGGRIVEVFASGEMEKGQLLAFYDKTLPQLGWHRKGSGLFQREGETLSLEFSSNTKNQLGASLALTVGFRIKPTINKIY